MDKENGTAAVDAYIAGFPPEVRVLLGDLRAAIREAAPDAAETICYGIPTFYLHGNLVHFAAHAKHLGFYPTPEGIEAFRDEQAGYRCSKGAVQFPFGEPLPLDLVRRIVAFRAAANRAKAAGRGRAPGR